MSLKIEKALKGRVVLLHGEEEALRRRALADLLAAAEVVADDFDLATIVADALPVAEWIAAASTAPFLAARRVVIVRNVLRIDPRVVSSEKANRPARDRFVAELRSLPESALLVLVADEEAGSEDRLRRLASARTALSKIVEEAGGVAAEFRADPKAAKSVIASELARLNRRMSPAAMDSLLAMTGGSASRAMEEIEKLALYTERDPIGEADVQAVVFPSPEWSIWKLVDAVAAGRPKAALGQLKELMTAGKKPEEAALQQILPMLGRQMRLLWQARTLLDAGKRPGNAPPELLATFPDKPNLAKEPEYRQNAILSAGSSITAPQLAVCLRALADADAALKGMIDSQSTADTLETMVLRMCETVRPGR